MSEPSKIRGWKRGAWEVRVEPVDGSAHVYPGSGLMESSKNWYPRTAWGLRRAIRRCQRWCDRQNVRERRGEALVAKAEAMLGEERLSGNSQEVSRARDRWSL